MFSLPALLFACQPVLSDLTVAPTATDAVPSDTGASVVEEKDRAGDLEISKVSIYQGVEAVLYEDGDAPTTFESPVLTNRDALLRVFVDVGDNFEARKINGILTVAGGADAEDVVIESNPRISDDSTDADLDSTINFELTADLIKKPTEFSLELRENKLDAPGEGKPRDTTWASEDYGGLDTEQTDDVTIVIIPVRYNYDGSGRLPDTDASDIAAIQELAYGMYPASTVTVRVDPPLNWPNRISAFNSWEWSDILDEVSDMRDAANEAPNTYYYGMFNPAQSLTGFCGQGCILGLSNLGWNSNSEYLRASVGVGYAVGGTASDTLVHEVGHAHGREHAPCGVYGQPTDRDYPYGGASIGAWGYDLVNGAMKSPSTTVDMMSYCSNIWVSDYTFYELWQRIEILSDQNRMAPQRVTRLRVGPEGRTEVRGSVDHVLDGAGDQVSVQLFDDRGQPSDIATGSFFPNSHFEGGIVALDRELAAGWTAQVLSIP